MRSVVWELVCVWSQGWYESRHVDRRRTDLLHVHRHRRRHHQGFCRPRRVHAHLVRHVRRRSHSVLEVRWRIAYVFISHHCQRRLWFFTARRIACTRSIRNSIIVSVCSSVCMSYALVICVERPIIWFRYTVPNHFRLLMQKVCETRWGHPRQGTKCN